MSDFFLNNLNLSPDMAYKIQSLKGISFVLVSGLVISLLLWREGLEKNVLLAEIHHRVKNNLAIISAFLELQANSVNSDALEEKIDPRNFLLSSVRRIKTMAISHEILYNQNNLNSIQTESLIQNIWEYSLESNSKNQSNPLISKSILKKNIQTKTIQAKLGIPIALILNELFNNSFQHGFPGNLERSNPIVEVEIGSGENSLFLIYRDNGIGLQDKKILSRDSKSGLGIFIIKTLTKQVNGEIIVDREKDMEIVFHFPRK
ncbi:MAG: sensor histidine kinase [Leptospira sp.]|nr:sensor histidine kinase [Leptospira sp.]